jgi:catechol 2,3-dioxygenase
MTPPPIDPALRIASVQLGVSDLGRSTDFYERVLGLPLVSREDERALFGPDRKRPLLALSRLDAPTPPPRGATGLFHFALLHPTRADLGASVLRLAQSRWPIDGVADHGVSEAIYLSDPDGLGIELYVDRPRDQWERPANGRGVKMVTLPLDLDDLLAQTSGDQAPAVPVDTVLGHVHLKVSDLPRSAAFYRDALGFEEQASMPSAGFLSAGGYHHHVGINSWHSRGGSPPPESAPGLRLVEFQLSGEGLTAIERRLSEDSEGPGSVKREEDGRLEIGDPDGNQLAFF